MERRKNIRVHGKRRMYVASRPPSATTHVATLCAPETSNLGESSSSSPSRDTVYTPSNVGTLLANESSSDLSPFEKLRRLPDHIVIRKNEPVFNNSTSSCSSNNGVMNCVLDDSPGLFASPIDISKLVGASQKGKQIREANLRHSTSDSDNSTVAIAHNKKRRPRKIRHPPGWEPKFIRPVNWKRIAQLAENFRKTGRINEHEMRPAALRSVRCLRSSDVTSDTAMEKENVPEAENVEFSFLTKDHDITGKRLNSIASFSKPMGTSTPVHLLGAVSQNPVTPVTSTCIRRNVRALEHCFRSQRTSLVSEASPTEQCVQAVQCLHSSERTRDEDDVPDEACPTFEVVFPVQSDSIEGRDKSLPGEIMVQETEQVPSTSPKNVLESLDLETVKMIYKSFSADVTMLKNKIVDDEVDAEAAVLGLCLQKGPLTFTELLPPTILSTCEKIGEGTYSEVYQYASKGASIVLKIVPVECKFMVNEANQKSCQEILPELMISRELSSLKDTVGYTTPNFVSLQKFHCVVGKYPEKLLSEWDIFAENKESQNDRPDMFDHKQKYVIFELPHAGTPLEFFKMKTTAKAKTIFMQVALSLAVAELALQFEHRDLHWGNILIRKTSETTIDYVLNKHKIKIETEGIFVTIIDFTISRMKKGATTLFLDLATDNDLFTGEDDYQFEIYRMMKEKNGNNWKSFFPQTNVMWLHYLGHKLLKEKNYPLKTKKSRSSTWQLKQWYNDIMTYESAYEFVQNEFF